MPRDVAVAHPRAEEVKRRRARGATSSRRRCAACTRPTSRQPTTHLLSNGRYAVMLTATGSGYSRWRDIAVTRWREDATCDDWGSFVFLRETQSGEVWSAACSRAGRGPTGTTSSSARIAPNSSAATAR